MKPGITGLWQVRARREPDFDRWVAADLEYIDRWSLWLDLKILELARPSGSATTSLPTAPRLAAARGRGS